MHVPGLIAVAYAWASTKTIRRREAIDSENQDCEDKRTCLRVFGNRMEGPLADSVSDTSSAPDLAKDYARVYGPSRTIPEIQNEIPAK